MLLLLKILGIILLILLGLVLLILFLVLFVPLRYRQKLVKNSQVLTADGRLSWLFGFLLVTVAYADGNAAVKFSIAGRTLKNIQKAVRPAVRKKASSVDVPTVEHDFPVRPETKEAEQLLAENTGEKTEGEEPEKEKEEESKAEKDKSDNNSSEYRKKDNEKTENSSLETSKSEKRESAKNLPEEKHRKTEPEKDRSEEKRTDRSGILDRIIEAVSSVPEKLMNLLLLAADIIQSGMERTDELSESLEQMKKKLSPLTGTEAKNLFHLLVRKKKMLYHFRPRNVLGFMRFGLNRPDLTARAGGLLYILLPAGAGRFKLEPDWEERVFECDMTMKGHIRLCHVAALALQLLLHRDTWKLIKKLRKKKY